MADSVRPWISEYLIETAETVGANVGSIPLSGKSKKVQLVEFLTHAVTEKDDVIWGKVSDKAAKIPVRFSREAMSEYNRNFGKQLTEYKTAIISIMNFRPFFARVPLGPKRGMSTKSFLALDVGSFSVIGSVDERVWGNPQEVETNEDLRLWSDGLRQDGGGGNILMDRKKERENGAKDITAHTKSPPRPAQQDLRVHAKRPLPIPSRQPASTHHAQKPAAALRASNAGAADLGKEWDRSWRPIVGNPLKYHWESRLAEERSHGSESNKATGVSKAPQDNPPKHPVATSSRHVLDLGSSPPPEPEHDPVPLAMQVDKQTTPAPDEWPESDGSSQASIHVPSDSGEDRGNEQKPLAIPPIHIKDEPIETKLDPSALPPPTLAQESRSSLPRLSPPTLPEPSVPIKNDPSPTTVSMLLHTRHNVTRKVPYPTLPLLPARSPSSPARILVPNSDPSAVASQSQQSQPRSQTQPPSQSTFLFQQPGLPEIRSKERGSSMPSCIIEPSQPERHDDERSSPIEPFSIESKFERRNLSPRNNPDNAEDASISRNSDRPRQRPVMINDAVEIEAIHEEEELPRAITAKVDAASRSAPSGMDEAPVEEAVLDEDDAQIEEQLFSVSGTTPPSPAQRLGSSTRMHSGPSPPVEVGPSKPTSIPPRASSPSPPSVEHDIEAWKTPYFLRKNGTNGKGKEKVTLAGASNDASFGKEKPDASRRGSSSAERVNGNSRSRHSSPPAAEPSRATMASETTRSSSRRQSERTESTSAASQSATRSTTSPGRELAGSSRGKNKRSRDNAEPPPDVKTDAPEGSSKRRKVTLDPENHGRRGGTEREDGGNRELPRAERHPVRVKKEWVQDGRTPPKDTKVNGFQVDFDHVRCDDEKDRWTWCSWNVLAQIVLRTGKMMTKYEQKREKMMKSPRLT